MTASHLESTHEWTARWGKADVIRMDDGTYALPVVLERDGVQIRTYVLLDGNEAAVIHAQFSRYLTDGWAMTENEKTVRRYSRTNTRGETP